jgi:hypothetical protein
MRDRAGSGGPGLFMIGAMAIGALLFGSVFGLRGRA